MASPPREFLGMARRFYQQVWEADGALNPAVEKIHKLVQPRLRTKATLRPEMIFRAEQIWLNEVPETFRLAVAFQHPKKRRGLRIRECRLSCMDAHELHWKEGDKELNIGVSMLDLRVDAVDTKSIFSFDIQPIAQVSLHALARRYERGRDRSDKAVFEDLVALSKPGFFEWTDRVAVASGIWLGERREFDMTEGDKVMAQADCFTVRTFYDNDMLLDGAKLTV